MNTVFIDGQEGTTGLKIFDCLKERADIEFLEIPREKRKDVKTKTIYLNQADLVILCLPDHAARESVRLITNPSTKVIDTSTAHRISEEWVYGLPELSKDQREKIRTSFRVSNPGCYTTGFILALYPLIAQDIVPVDYPVTLYAITGYSGGGKKMISLYENYGMDKPDSISSRPKDLSLRHKHIPEMQKLIGLSHAPIFTPIVGNFFNGLLVLVPVFSRLLNKKLSAKDVRGILASYYASEPFVRVMPYESEVYLEDGLLSPTGCNGTNRVELFVFGHDRQILLVARLDNLGKGASGAAVQNMNLMFGFKETEGLQ